MPEEKQYDMPPVAEDGFYTLCGFAEGDEELMYYTVPSATTVREIVRYFEVGAHGGVDGECVAGKASKLVEMFGGHAVYADPAGLKIKFDKIVTESDLDAIGALFDSDEDVMAGGEMYMSMWEEDKHMYAPVLEENVYHFWWD